MSLVRKMQEGAETPTLYTMYDKQYDFNDLQRTADQGLAEYLAGLKRGSKDETQFREAYNNIMMGIKDGSITYQDGRFIDTKYGYQNSPDKDKNKDHYGLMANYIFNKMGKSQEYVKPEDKSKIKWTGLDSARQALMRELYNSDTENIAAFQDLDRDDLNSTTNRVKELYNKAVNYRNKFDKLFTGYTDTDNPEYRNYLDQAIAALADGSYDAGDYLALSRAFGNLDYSRMFGNERSTTRESENSQSQKSDVQLFQEFMDERHPQHTFTQSAPVFDYSTADKIQLIPEAQSAFNQALSGMTDEQLLDTLRRYIRTPQEAAQFQLKIGDQTTAISNARAAASILKYLKDNNKLTEYNFGESDLGSYYIPGSWKEGSPSGLVWNTVTGKVSEMDYLKIPYLRAQIAQEFNNWKVSRQSGQSGSHWLDSYGFYKNGGIIKAYDGTKFDNILDAITYTSDDLSDDRRFRNLFQNGVINNMALRGSNPASDNIATNNKAYDPELGGKETEAQDWWENWTKLLTSRQDLAEAWARRYLSLNNTTDENSNLVHGQNWFNPDNSFNFDNFKNTVSPTSAKAYWNDQVNGIGHDFYRGRVYQIDGENGYYQNILDGYELVGDPKLDSGNLAYVYTMRKKGLGNQTSQDGTPSPQSDATKINPVTGDINKSKGDGQGFLSILEDLAPDLFGVGRLALSLHTNNRVARTIRPSLKPVLRDTYERYSPVTGAFSTMQLKNRQAADVLRQSNQAFTSDASLTAARMLEGQKQANQLQAEGFLADDQEIKRTQQEALARQEDNIARRSEVANVNRASINQTNREIAQLEATRLRSNWQSWDNYLQGVEGRLRTWQQERETAARTAAHNRAQTEYSDALAKLDSMYKEAHPNSSTTSMLNDSNYTEAVRQLRQTYSDVSNNIPFRIYPYRRSKPKSYEDILGSVKFSRNGGVLNPNALNLINKVIRNESNT